MTDDTLYAAALTKPPEERREFLEAVCGADADRLDRLTRRLAAHESMGDAANPIFGSEPASGSGEATVAYRASLAIDAGELIDGRFQVIDCLGEGGMGTVYVAEQLQPVRRTVALKLVKAGMDSQAVLARFEAERQALALMDHPNIAKVFDAGLTAQGRPFFVMEFIQGVPLTDYCDAARLDVAERLALFVAVCQAVQHAHQKGIIHRDLKPSNILVAQYDPGAPGVPKVIDFGLAKAIHEPLADRTLQTAHGMVLGTPLYMSPEQAELNNFDIDTRSDIYALGVILYELLTGATPLDRQRFKAAALDEMLRMVREEEPPKPSTRLSELNGTQTPRTDPPGSAPRRGPASLAVVAAHRRVEPSKLRRMLRGELDWIVMKAIDKDRGRRYESANDFAMDIQRYLAEQPVNAGPPSAAYRVRKFVRRNKGPVVAAAVVLLALVAGMIGTTLGLIESRRQAGIARAAQRDEAKRAQAEANERHRAELAEADAKSNEEKAKQERDRAESEKRIAQAVRAFLQRNLLGQADPRVQANSLLLIGASASEARRDVSVRELLDRAATELAPDRIDVNFPDQQQVQAEILQTVGDSYHGVGEFAAAIEHLKRSYARRLELLGPDDEKTQAALHNLAATNFAAGNLKEAIRLFEQLREQQERTLGAEDEKTLNTLNSLGLAYRSAGKRAEAIRLLERVRIEREQALGPDHVDTLLTVNNLALVYHDTGKVREAIQLFEHVRAIREEKLGDDHPSSLVTLNNLASSYKAVGRLDEAIELLTRARAKFDEQLGPDHADAIAVANNLGEAYLSARRMSDAVSVYEPLREVVEAKLDRDHSYTLAVLHNLAAAYRGVERLDESIQLQEQVLASRERTQGPDHPDTLTAINNLAAACWSAKTFDRSVSLYEMLLPRMRARFGDDHSSTFGTAFNLAVNYRDAGRLDEAVGLFDEWLPRAIAKLPPGQPSVQFGRSAAIETYERAGSFDRLIPLHKATVEDARRAVPVNAARLGAALASLGSTLLKAEQPADAENPLREALALREAADPDAWTTFNTKSLLGVSLLGQKEFASAEPLLRAGYEAMKQRESQIPPQIRQARLNEALKRLVQLYDASGKTAEATEWRKKLESAGVADPK
jgi:serine/threonine protein kinase